MDTLCQPVGHTLVTTNCTFKLYGRPWPDRVIRALRGLAATWISEATAGFVPSQERGSTLSVYWWEGRSLRRLSCDPSAPGRRLDLDALTVASVDDLPLLAFEAASWMRHVLDGRPPSVTSYLADVYA